MKRAILVAAVLVALAVSGSAFGYASDPSLVTWADSFDAQALGIVPGTMTGWTGGGPVTWSTVSDGGNVVVSTGGTNGGWTYGWTSQVIGGQLSLGLEAYNVQIMHARMRKAGGAGVSYRNGVSVYRTDGVPMATWRICSAGYQPFVWNSSFATVYAGPQIAWPDGNYHDLDLRWNKPTGQIDWYVDGASVTTYTYSDLAGYDVGVVEFDARPADASTIYIDDIKAGTVPEPSSLLVLGLGALGLIRRRSA